MSSKELEPLNLEAVLLCIQRELQKPREYPEDLLHIKAKLDNRWANLQRVFYYTAYPEPHLTSSLQEVQDGLIYLATELLQAANVLSLASARTCNVHIEQECTSKACISQVVEEPNFAGNSYRHVLVCPTCLKHVRITLDYGIPPGSVIKWSCPDHPTQLER